MLSGSMLKAAFRLLTGSIFGKLSGVLREILLARFFGTGTVASASRASQSATLIPVEFFAANALSAAFLPLYSSLLAESRESANTFFWAVFSLMMIVSLGLLILLMTFAEEWVAVVAPGFSDVARAVTIDLLRVASLGIPFYIIGNLISYLAMANQNFSLASIRATVQNVGMIIGICLAWRYDHYQWIAWSFVFSYSMYCAWAIFIAVKGGWAPLGSLGSLGLQSLGPFISRFFVAMRPLLALPVLLQAGVLVERAVASLISDSSVAALGYARLITETGVLLLAMPLGLAGLATMGSMSDSEAKKVVEKVLPLLLVVTVPLSAILVANGGLFVQVAFEHGEFDVNSSRATTAVLISMSAGLWAQVISYFLIKVMSARMKNRQVVIFTGISVALQVIVNVGLFSFLGNYTLGVGATLSAVVLSVLCSYSLRVMRSLSYYLSPMLVFGLVNLGLALLAWAADSELFSLVLVPVSVSLWCGVLLGFSRYRCLLIDCVRYLKRRRDEA